MKRRAHIGDGPDDGSILIETLIAAAILAAILGAAYQVTLESAARRDRIEARRYALMVARSALAAAGAATSLATGATEGVDGDDVWRVAAQPCGAGDRASPVGQLVCITVSVRSTRGGPPLVTLTTRRLAPAA